MCPVPSGMGTPLASSAMGGVVSVRAFARKVKDSVEEMERGGNRCDWNGVREGGEVLVASAVVLATAATG
uniref:Uncharacterized protein n=1 Tax=Arundo donax TaxID=35708 RepID=A0A0A9C4Z5_ARUDO